MNRLRPDLVQALLAENTFDKAIAEAKALKILADLNNQHPDLELTLADLKLNNDEHFSVAIGRALHDKYYEQMHEILPLKKHYKNYLSSPGKHDFIEPEFHTTYHSLVLLTADVTVYAFFRKWLTQRFPGIANFWNLKHGILVQKVNPSIEELLMLDVVWQDHARQHTGSVLDWLKPDLAKFADMAHLRLGGASDAQLTMSGFQDAVRCIWPRNVEGIHFGNDLKETDIRGRFGKGPLRIHNGERQPKLADFKTLLKSIHSQGDQQKHKQFLAASVLAKVRSFHSSLARATEQRGPLPEIGLSGTEEIENPNENQQGSRRPRFDLPKSRKPLTVSDMTLKPTDTESYNELVRQGKLVARIAKRLLTKSIKEEEHRLGSQTEGTMLDSLRLPYYEMADNIFQRITHTRKMVKRSILLAIDMSSSLEPPQVAAIQSAAAGLVMSQRGTECQIAIAIYNSNTDGDEEFPTVQWIRFDSGNVKQQSSMRKTLGAISQLEATGANWDLLSMEHIIGNHQLEGHINLFVLSDGQFNSCESRRESGLTEMMEFYAKVNSSDNVDSVFLGFDANEKACGKLQNIMKVIRIESGQGAVGENIARAIINQLTN